MNVNQVALSGNLARDAELRQTRGGKPVISFPLAVAESVPDGQGGRTERASYFDVVCFFGSDRLAGILGKGQKVAVQGRLRQTSWKARDGSKRYGVEVVASGLDLMGSPRQRQEAPYPEPQQARDQDEQPPADVYDEDVPF